jgi:hypothetical protein
MYSAKRVWLVVKAGPGEAGAPCGPAKRAFGCDVNGLRLDRINLAANRRCPQTQFDFG